MNSTAVSAKDQVQSQSPETPETIIERHLTSITELLGCDEVDAPYTLLHVFDRISNPDCGYVNDIIHSGLCTLRDLGRWILVEAKESTRACAHQG